MNREQRRKMAEDTLRKMTKYPVDKGVYYSAEKMKELKKEKIEKEEKNTMIEVRNQDVVDTILQSKGKTLVLNFASARNPGGGFLSGSQAQEEAIAKTSNMYMSIKDVKEYYNNPKHHQSGYYDSDVIYSSDLKMFKNSYGDEVSPVPFEMVTSCAVNVKSLKEVDKKRIEEEMIERIENIFELAIRQDVETFIVGAWGCGVFKNEPEDIATFFSKVMKNERYKNKIDHIIFSIFKDENMIEIFKQKMK